MTSIYITSADKMLLLFRQGGTVVNDVWVGSAGGHFEEFELNDARACVLRELEEELGLKENEIKNLSLRYVTLRRAKGEIRQNYYFFAELTNAMNEPLQSDEGICKWFAYSELANLNMPFTAKYVIEHYLNIGRKTKDLYAAGSIKFGQYLQSMDINQVIGSEKNEYIICVRFRWNIIEK